MTEPFSLEGYAATDLPALYFNYFLLTEEIAGRDAFRVFISDNGREDDRGTWELLASNQSGEFDPTGFGVQPLFDNTWQDVPFLQDPADLTSWQRERPARSVPVPGRGRQRPFDPGDRGLGGLRSSAERNVDRLAPGEDRPECLRRQQ